MTADGDHRARRAPARTDLPDLDEAVELLERALVHTRLALAGIRPVHLARPTPCSRWDLDDLLWHMDDALDAFTEAAAGDVRPDPAPRRPAPGPTGVEARLGRLQAKACHLLGSWADPGTRPTGPVRVAGVPLAPGLLVGAAALEITVHGWDVARATGEDRPIPASLARRLLPVAVAGVAPTDRGTRFAHPVPLPGAVPADLRLLAFLGRHHRAADAA